MKESAACDVCYMYMTLTTYIDALIPAITTLADTVASLCDVNTLCIVTPECCDVITSDCVLGLQIRGDNTTKS